MALEEQQIDAYLASKGYVPLARGAVAPAYLQCEWPAEEDALETRRRTRSNADDNNSEHAFESLVRESRVSHHPPMEYIGRSG